MNAKWTAILHKLPRVRLGVIRHDGGSALVEFAFGFPVLITALFGVITGGLVLNRYMTVLQLGRNAAGMFSAGTDFATMGNKQLLLLAADGLGITETGGNGVVYLSRVEMAPPGTANDGQLVIAERHIIGETAVNASTVGQPRAQIWPDPDNPAPNGDVKDYQEELTALANLPSALGTLPLGESMYVAEIYHLADELRFGVVWDAPIRLVTQVYY